MDKVQARALTETAVIKTEVQSKIALVNSIIRGRDVPYSLLNISLKLEFRYDRCS